MREEGRLRTGVSWLVCAALLTALIATPEASARSGHLDKSFGEGGRAVTAANLGASWKKAEIRLATAPDGSTVVASDRQLLRYLPNGQLDQRFGEGGRLTLEGVEGLSFSFDDVAVDSKGRIVAFGTAEDLNTTFLIPLYLPEWVHPTFAIILRYNSLGRLDPSFGGGDGIVRTDLGVTHIIEAVDGSYPPLVSCIAGVIDHQDRPMLVAADYELNGDFHTSLEWKSRLVARFTITGDLDPSFGAGRGTTLRNTDNRGIAVGPASEPLLVWGGSQGTPRSFSRVTRLYVDGTLDRNYGHFGQRTISGGGGAAVPDRFGRLLILERPNDRPVHVLRLRPDGELDRSFGRGGRATIKLRGKHSALSSITVDARGRALLIGTSSRSAIGKPRYGEPGNFTIAVGLTASGHEDQRFGIRGRIRTGFGRRTKIASPNEVAATKGWTIVGPQAVLDARNRLVIAGVAHSPQLQPGGIVLARYLLDH